MSKDKLRRSSFAWSDWDIGDSAVHKRDSQSCSGTEYAARPALESSVCSARTKTRRSRCSHHPSEQVSEPTIRQDPRILGSRRIAISSPQRVALVRKSGPCRKCYYMKERTENAAAALRRTLMHRSRADITTVLRTSQIIAAARRPMTVGELRYAIKTRMPPAYYLHHNIKPNDELQDTCDGDRDNSLALYQDLLRRDSNGVVVNGVVDFCHTDMRNLICSVEFRRSFELAHEDEILAAICVQHLACRSRCDDDMASSSATRCPVTQEGDGCLLQEYAVSFWKEHYLRVRGGNQMVHSLLHETIVSSLAKEGHSKTRCQRSCNDVLATGMEMAATHDLPVLGKVYHEMGADVRQCNHSTHTPLHTAVANSSGEMLRLLLDYGADYNAIATNVPCSCSAADAAISNALALRNPRHNQCHCWRCCRCFSGRTPLHLAAVSGQETSVRILVAAGADINISTKGHGDTALHLATKAGDFGIVHFLVTSQADVRSQNSMGETALQLAKLGHHYLIIKLLLAVAPPVVTEPKIEATDVGTGHEEEQASTPVWRMHTLSLEDKPSRLSFSFPKTEQTPACHTNSPDTYPQTRPEDKDRVRQEESWVFVGLPETFLQEAQSICTT